MQCEICGREIHGRGHTIVVEGSEMTVCSLCKDYGEEKSTVVQHGIVKVVKKEKKVKPIEFTEELVENYNEIIKREREKRGWSQEELAKKIQEKASLIRKIENKEITPEPEVVEKLERTLGVKLREKVEEVKIQGRKLENLTLGDVVIIRKKKK
ncbi:multiprotein bridging factor aMBF1 [Ferroglobus sp.]|uniref:multiprotein bridging factor aMBF1 n=1 Tax=Ferroglobus sp. TaxID=2614230 RepID=UPI0025BB10FD|nr:multiprotein bridging factor aMBF1 [Ferroglobus sp.]